MAAYASIIKIYAGADSAGKVDIICRFYPNFMGIIDGHTEGLLYMIENEKSYNRNKAHGDAGVRVQCTGRHSDITADTAISNVITREAIITCDFSGGVLEEVDRGDEFQKEALILRNMRKDYELFNNQLGILSNDENKLFYSYLKRERNLADLADDAGIQYESVCQKLRRVKKKIKIQMIGFLDGTL